MKTAEQVTKREEGGIRLLDHLVDSLKLRNDAALAKRLQVAPPVISKIRHRRLAIGPSFILKAHEHGGMEVKAIRAMLEA